MTTALLLPSLTQTNSFWSIEETLEPHVPFDLDANNITASDVKLDNIIKSCQSIQEEIDHYENVIESETNICNQIEYKYK